MVSYHYSELKQCSVGLTVFCGIFLTFNLNAGIFCRILSVLQHTVLDLNNVVMRAILGLVEILIHLSCERRFGQSLPCNLEIKSGIH